MQRWHKAGSGGVNPVQVGMIPVSYRFTGGVKRVQEGCMNGVRQVYRVYVWCFDRVKMVFFWSK